MNFDKKNLISNELKSKIEGNENPVGKGLPSLEEKTHHTAAEIIVRLKELLLAAMATNFSSELNEAALTVLDKALQGEKDICARLGDIAEKSFTSPVEQCRQLRDMQLYLTLLDNHVQKNSEEESRLNLQEKGLLHALVDSGKKACDSFSAIIAPKWRTHVDALETAIKTALPQQQSLQSLSNFPSLLTTHKGTALDSKIFAHVQAEALIKGTSYEGEASSTLITYLKHYLSQNKKTYENISELSSLVKMMEDAELLCQAGKLDSGVSSEGYTFAKDFPRRCKAFTDTLFTIISELKPGKKTLVPIGWTTRSGGHSMKMGVEREKEGTLRITIYNTGSGLNLYHAALQENRKELYQPFIDITAVEEKRLLDPDFIRALLEIQVINTSPNRQEGRDTNYSATDIYELLLKALGGTALLCRGERDKFMQAQQSGICTWASLVAVLHTLLPPKDFHQIASGLSFDSLCTYYQAKKETLATDEEARRLLQHGAIRCAQSTLDAYENGAISTEQLGIVYATIKELEDTLAAVQAQINHGKLSEEQLTFEKVEPQLPQYFPIKQWKWQSPPDEGLSPLPDKTTSSKITPFSFEWMTNPKEIVEGIGKLVKYVQSCSADGREEEGIRSLEKFFALEAQMSQEEIWNKIEDGELSAALMNLADLGEQLFTATNRFPNNIRAYTSYAFYLKALAIKLASNISETKSYIEKGISSPQFCLDTICEDKNLYNAEERVLHQKAQKSFSSKTGENLLFTICEDKYDVDRRYESNKNKVYPKTDTTSEISYIRALVEKSPSLKEKLSALYPESKDKLTSTEWQIALSLNDWYGEILPPAFCALRRLTHIAELLLKEKVLDPTNKPLFKTEVHENTEKPLQFEYEYVSKNIYKSPTERRDFIKDKLFNELVKIREFPWDKSFGSNQPGKESDVMVRPLDEWQRDLSLILTRGDVNKENSFNEQQVIKTIAYFSSHKEKLNDPDMRMLCRFLLFEKDYIEKLLEKNPAFGKILADFVQRNYIHFIEDKNIAAATFFIEIGRAIETIVRFKKIEQPFPDFRKLLTDQLSQNITSNEERTLLYQQLAASYESKPPPPEEFSPEDTTNLLTALLHNRVYPLRKNTNKATDHLNDQLKRSFSRWQAGIQIHLQSPEGEKICNKILQTFDASAPKNLIWDCHSHYPYCISGDGLYALNITNLQVLIKNKSISSLPESTLNNEIFQKLFSKENYPCRVINWSCYEFTDERGITTQVSGSGKDLIVRQQLDGGHWYENSFGFALIPAGVLPDDFTQPFCSIFTSNNTTSVWVPLDKEAPLEILLRDNSHKITHTIKLQHRDRCAEDCSKALRNPPFRLTKEEQEQAYQLLVGNQETINNLRPLAEKIRDKIFKAMRLNKFFTLQVLADLSVEQKEKINELKKIFHDTRESNGSEGIKRSRLKKSEGKSEKKVDKFLATPPATPLKKVAQQLLQAGKLINSVCSLYIEMPKNQCAIESCNKLSETGEILTLINLKHAPPSLLQATCGAGMLWKDGSGALKLLELPSLGLSFAMKNENGGWHAYSSEHPGFFLAPNQCYRGLEAIPRALVLENNAGMRKLILPYGEICPERVGSLKTKFEIRIYDKTPNRTIAFDLDSLSQPIVKYREQQLYLANILLEQKQYSTAQMLLRASFSHVIPYNEQEKKLLIALSFLPKENNDTSPHATAVALTALSLLPPPSPPNAEEKNDKNIVEELKDLAEQYLSYKQQLGIIPDLNLSKEEERKAINYFFQSGIGSVQLLKSYASSTKEDLKTSRSLKFPPLKDLKKRTFNPKAFFNEERQNWHYENPAETSLVTRPLKFFTAKFLQLYELALTDPIKLEIFLAAAEQDPAISQPLITLFRSVALCKRHPNPLFPAFPPTLKELEKIYYKKNEQELSQIITIAEEVENDWKKKEAEGVNQKQKNLTLTGVEEGERARKQEALSIQMQPLLAATLPVEAVPARKALLTTEQLTAFQEVPTQALQLSHEEILRLQDAVSERGEKPLPIESDELSKHIATYWNLDETKAAWHKLKPEPETLSQTKTLLLVERSQMGKRIALLEQELLAFANQLPQDEMGAILFETEKKAHFRKEISLQDLTLFAARPRYFSLSGKGSNLAQREKLLQEKTLFWLEAKAHQQQLSRALTHLTAIEKGGIEKNSQEYARLSQQCFQELTRIPPYRDKKFPALLEFGHNHPELLVFEVLEGIGLRKEQVEDLKRMLAPDSGENVILEKVMGSGKSKVYLPLLALSKADGDNLPIVIVHSSQYDSVAQAMQITSGQTFSQVAHTVNFSRGSDSSAKGLKKILDECELVRKQRHFLVVTDKTMHSLSLAFSEMWDTYLAGEKNDKVLLEKIAVMRKIFTLFKEKGKATLDEADLLLNCRYEVVYALGDPQPIEPAHCNIVAELYQSIASDLEKLMPFTREGYEAIKSGLIDTFVKNVVKRTMPECDAEKVGTYLKGDKAGAGYVERLTKAQRDLLAIVFYEFKELLPLTLEKRCGEHYGYSDRAGKILPVPYVASGTPSPTSEFSFPYVLLNYTIQTLQNQGASPSLLKQLIQNMRERSTKELQADPTLQLDQTQGYKDFSELCKGKISMPFRHTTDSEIEELAKRYKDDSQGIYTFAKKFLFPAVAMHRRKLTSTPYTLESMFKEVQGFTGTPWNNKTYPKNLEVLRDKFSAGKTQGIIWKNSQVIHTLPTEEFSAVIKEISTIQQGGEYHAFIDVGALFNGIGNQQVAESFLKMLPKEQIQGVLFFKDNKACVLERGKKEPVAFERCGLSPQQLYVFYDQWHTTGTDFKIAGKSLLSIGKNTKMRDLEQGYMRDRQAELGERVEFIVGPEDKKFIEKELHLPEKNQLSTADCLRLTQINQERELKEQLLMACFGRIKQVANSYLQKQLLDPSLPPEGIWEQRIQIRQLLGEVMEDNPFEAFGSFKELEATKVFFEGVITDMVDKMMPLLGKSSESLRQQLWDCIDLDFLPKELAASAKHAPEQLVEQQSQQQAQQERMAMVQKETISDQVSSNKLGPLHWNWDAGVKSYKRSYYQLKPSKHLLNSSLPYKIEEVPVSEGQIPLLSVKDIFTEFSTLKEFADIFDIEATYNFLPIVANVLEASRYTTITKSPFKKGQLIVQNLLICKDRETGDVQIRMISQAEQGFFYDKLAADRAEAPEGPEASDKREIDVTLYNLTLGVTQSNSRTIAEGKEEVLNEATLKKIVQAKFFNGDSIYNRREQALLATWVTEKGAERMKRLFCNHILPNKDETKRNEFTGSFLSTLFPS